MRVLFTAHRDDAIGCTALRLLEHSGYPTHVIENGTSPPPHCIGLFGVEKEVRNRYLRLPPHRMPQEGIDIPEWGKDLPFLVAISGGASRKEDMFHPGLRSALQDMAHQYENWGPWMKDDAPWRPNWSRGKHERFGEWRARAGGVVDSTCYERLTHRLKPVFDIKDAPDIRRLVITGCALFNAPHTDVVDTIAPEKRGHVIEQFDAVIHDSCAEDVQFIVPRSDLLCDMLREHFHIFMFMSIDDVAKHLVVKMHSSARLLGHTHARSDAEIAAALERSAEGITREIVRPLQASSHSPVRAIPWTGYIGPYLSKAQEIAQRHRETAEKVYQHRVSTRPSYASLHKLDPARGLARTIANNVFYIAEAMYLKDNPDTAVVNCEFEDAFWKGLEQVLEKEVWGDFRPFIGMVPESARQPWGY